MTVALSELILFGLPEGGNVLAANLIEVMETGHPEHVSRRVADMLFWAALHRHGYIAEWIRKEGIETKLSRYGVQGNISKEGWNTTTDLLTGALLPLPHYL